MRIIIIANTYWNIVNFRQPIIRMLKEKGVEVFISTPFDVNYAKEQREDDRFIGLKYADKEYNGSVKIYQAVREYRSVFKRVKPDMLLLYTMKPNIYANIAAVRLNIPVISTVTGLGYTFIRGGLTRYLSERLYKFAFRKTQHIVFHNPDDKKLFVEQGFAPSEKCRVIRGSGVNVEKFHPLPQARNTGKFIFIFIGRLLTDKGVREYLTAAKELEADTKIEFHIVGDLYPENPASLSIKEWSVTLREAKNIVWHKNQNDVRPFLAAADCMVLPSYREGLPMSVLEAMAMGLPIITTDVPGCRETVEDGVNGYLIDAKNFKHLGKKILEMYNLSQEKRLDMGRRSREKAVYDFSSEIVAKAYEKLIFG